MTWDQGMGASVPSLKGFENHFESNSGAQAEAIQDFATLPYLGYIIGSTLSFFINDRIGRKWFLRVSIMFHAIGQLMAIFAPDTDVLDGSRIMTGIGIGGFTVIGPMTLAEIAPAEIRGIITSIFMIFMGLALFMAQLIVWGINRHMAVGRLQYQIIFIIPMALMALVAACSFFTCDSPIWLAIVGRKDEALDNLGKLRGLPRDHPRVQRDMNEILQSVSPERPPLLWVVKETFTKKSNLRRVQQTFVTYALAQLSGANSLTSYFIPIITLMDPSLDTDGKIFMSSMVSSI
jgi:MFS family permease